MLILEGAQAGLSWLTILRKREHYRVAFDGFDAEKIARYPARKVNALLQDPGIVRNRLKIQSAVTNARACLDILESENSLAEYLWQFVAGAPVTNHWHNMQQVPATTPTSDLMSKTLRQRGFKFVGSTICYAYMQAVGMVNDHLVTCPRHRACAVA
jgi:DNA-3-methyladenine glycosylase I